MSGGRACTVHGRSVLVAPASQLAVASIAIERDGVVARLVICPAGLAPAQLPSIAVSARADTIISDLETTRASTLSLEFVEPSGREFPADHPPARDQDTEWILLPEAIWSRAKTF